MPAPTEDPEWATDPTYDAPGEAWDGLNPNLDPGAGLIAQGYKPRDKPNARNWNWLQNLWGRWISWLRDERDRMAPLIGGDTGAGEWAYPSGRARTVQIAVAELASGEYSVVAGVATGGIALEDGWRPRELEAAGTVTHTGHVETVTPGLNGSIDISDLLPSGATITGVSFYVDPGSAQASADDRMRCRLMKRDASGFAGPTVIGTATTDATANQQTVSLGALAEVVSRSTRVYSLEVRSSAGAAGGTPDILCGVAITFNDPGPRNY